VSRYPISLMRLLDSEDNEPVPDENDGSTSQAPVAKQGQDALARFVQAGRVILTADLESKLQELEHRMFGSLDERFNELHTQWSRELELRMFGSLAQWSREVKEDVNRQLLRRQESGGGGSQAEGSRSHDAQPSHSHSHSANKHWPRRTPPAPGRAGKGSRHTSHEDNSLAERLKRLEGIVGGLIAANAEIAKNHQPPEAPASGPPLMKSRKGAGRRPPPLEPEDVGCSVDTGGAPVCDSDVARQPQGGSVQVPAEQGRQVRSSSKMLHSPQSPGSPDPELSEILARRRSISEGLSIRPMPPLSAEVDEVQTICDEAALMEQRESIDAGQHEATAAGQQEATTAGQQDSPMIGKAETDEEAHQPSPPGKEVSASADGEQHHLSVSSLSATTDEEAAPGDEQFLLQWRQRRRPHRSRSNSSGGLLEDTPLASHREVLGDSAATLDAPVLHVVAPPPHPVVAPPCASPGEVPSPMTVPSLMTVPSPMNSVPPSPNGKKFRNLKHPTSGTMSPAISFGTLPTGSPNTVVAWEPSASPPVGGSVACSPQRLPSAPNLQHPPAAWESGPTSPGCSITCPSHSALSAAGQTVRKQPSPQVVTVLPPAVEVPKLEEVEVNSPTRVRSSPALIHCDALSAPVTASTMARLQMRANASPLKVTVRGPGMQTMQPLVASGRTISHHRLVDDRTGLARTMRQSASSWFTPPRPQLVPTSMAPAQSVHLEGLASSPSEPTVGTNLTSHRPFSSCTNLLLSPTVNAAARPTNDTGSSRWAPTAPSAPTAPTAPPSSGQRQQGLSPSPPRSSKTGSASVPAGSCAMERVAPRAATPQRCMTSSSRNPGSSPPRAVVRTPRLLSPGSSPPATGALGQRAAPGTGAA